MKQQKNNPFTLDFGKEPSEMIPRPRVTEELIRSFSAARPSLHVSLITGPEGSGKTVLLTSVCNQFRKEKSWVVIELNPELDLLQGLISKLGADKTLKTYFTSAGINLSAFGLGPQIRNAEPVTDVETALSRMLAAIKKHRKRVLVAVDEVTASPDMRVFAAAFQILLRQDLPLFLLAAGLYENIRALQDQEALSFLHRAPRVTLGPLNIGRITESYGRIFALDSEKAMEMAKKTKGYAFAYQVLGYVNWKFRKDPEKVQAEYKQYLEEYIYERIWCGLSGTDQRILYAIAKTPDGSVASVREKTHMTSNQFTPYRTRLIRKGIINGDTHGIVRFTLPMFGQFVLENYEPDPEP